MSVKRESHRFLCCYCTSFLSTLLEGLLLLPQDVSLSVQIVHHLVHSLRHAQIASLDTNLRVLRFLIGIIHSSHSLNDSLSRLGVQSLLVPLLAQIQRGCHVDLHESTLRLARFPHKVPAHFIGRNGRGNGQSTRSSHQTGNETNPFDVEVAVFLAESQLTRHQLAHIVTIQDGHASFLYFHQLFAQCIGNG